MKNMQLGSEFFLVINILINVRFSTAAEYENYNSDITNVREFGCRWYGGTASRLICNCDEIAEMTIKKGSIPSFSTAEIEINHCKSVTFEEECILGMRNLRAITLNNIGSLNFNSNSVQWYGYKERGTEEEERFDITMPSLKVTTLNSKVSEISSHAFSGRISEINFDGCTIDHIYPIAFANLVQTEKISIKNSRVERIDVQAFKTFSTESVELNGLTVKTVTSRALSNITVYENFTIENCNFDTVHSGAFTVFNPKTFQVTNTNISLVNGEAFKIISRGVVVFRQNNFQTVNDGAFQGITLRRDGVQGEVLFIFDTNTFTNLYRYSLNIPDFAVKYKNVYINETCDCTSINHKIKESIYYEDMLCLYENEYITLQEFRSHLCSVITNYYVIIIIVSIVIVLVVVSLAALFFYYKLVYRSKKYGSKERNKNRGNLSLIVPDGRTYRETELHVIVEKTDLLTTDL